MIANPRNMNKKILLVGWGFPPNIDGGLDIHVKHLFEELQKKDVDVSLVLPEEYAPDRKNVIPVETSGDMIRRARDLSAKVAGIAENYDFVHTHDWFGAEAGFKAKKYGDVKWISTIHSLSSGRTRNGSVGELEKLEELAVEEPDKKVAVSQKLALEVEEEYGKKPEVIHNGFSTPEKTGKDVKEEIGIEDKMVFFVGRHAEQKGIEHLLYGFKKFLEYGKAELVVGGDGYMRESLEEFAEMLGVREKVYFVDYIPSEELGDYYFAADLFVSPSINEPFGLTITEALESGTPVLATENGVSEISSEHIIETEPDSEKISEGITEGLEFDSEVSTDARSWSEMTEELLGVYRDL
jgi:glycosyltransferase involved in cell wall biosynthesis